MEKSQIEKTSELVHSISFKFSKIKNIQKHLDIVFVFGSADNHIRLPEKTNKIYSCIIKFFPKIASPQKLYYSQRKQFLDYIDPTNYSLKFVTIEELYTDLKNFGANLKGISAKRTRLVELERKAIEQASSLIVFPESVGSYAELGYFTAFEETKKKIYVVNHYEFTGHDSYMNHLIDEIHNARNLRAISLDYYSDDIKKTQNQFDEIINNLESKYKEDTYEKFQNSHQMLPLSVSFELLTMFPSLSFIFLFETTNNILKDIIKTDVCSIDEFSTIISLLVVSGYIQRKTIGDKTHFVSTKKENTFLKFELTEKEFIIVENAMITYEGIT